MNKRSSAVHGSQQERFERQLLYLARGLEYPRTPDVAGSVSRRLGKWAGMRREEHPYVISRRLVWSLTVLLILCASLMLIPPARAAILDFIQIGAVRIFRTESTPLPPPTAEFPFTANPLTATPAAPSTSLIPFLERIAGETTLAGAQKIVNYPILLPSYPRDLGQPDRVFIQEADGKMTILVWMDPRQPDRVLMSLHLIPPGSWVIKKANPTVIQETTIHGERALWTTGPYPIQFSNGDIDFIRLIDGHVLIWFDGEMTYRLETNLDLEEALKIADSLEPIR